MNLQLKFAILLKLQRYVVLEYAARSGKMLFSTLYAVRGGEVVSIVWRRGGQYNARNAENLVKKLKKRFVKYNMQHYWDYCDMCGPMVRCGKCGNTCCNAMHGILKDGKECDACPDAYKIQKRDFQLELPKWQHIPQIRAWRSWDNGF